MKIALIIIRSLLGLMLIMASVVILFNLVDTPVLEGKVKVFNDGMVASGYLMTLIKVTELVCGLCFISGRYVTLASVVMFPISVNIFLYNVFLSPEALPMAAFVLLANLFLAYYYRKNYTSLFAV